MLRTYTPLRVALGLVVLSLLWHVVGSLSWLADVWRMKMCATPTPRRAISSTPSSTSRVTK